MREESTFPKFMSMYTSEDLSLPQKVFDRLCQEHRLALKDRGRREQLAREVRKAFEDGFTDETELRRLSKRRTASVST